MDYFRQTNRRALLSWALLLSLALLCAQGVKLHVHAIDEVGDDSKAHFAHDTSHSDHHDGVIPKIDISPDGLLKNTHNNVFAIVLFALFFTWMIFISSRPLVHYRRESKLILHSFYVLSPPLRAPPQH
ncbi:hypothetical protein MNBD_GAMMA16-143 [hydrothermal vent metagenome]|uniref:Uncharacterized protein n=1 Tax=hydrothermal vent metagenome TaxID=652676 RepID=A0A3B0ZBD8_9ZZZZ